MVLNKEHLGIRSLYWIVMTGILGLVAYAAYTLFFPLVLGFLFAFLTDPVVDFLERRGWSRHSGSMLLFGVLLAGLVSLVAVLVPMLQKQAHDVTLHEQEYVTIVEARVSQIRATALKYFSPAMVAETEAEIRTTAIHKIQALQNSVPKILAAVAHALGIAIFVPIIGFFFLVEGAEIKKWVISLLPNRYFEMTLMLLNRVNSQLGGYMRGQALDCMINGFLYGLGMTLLGVKGGAVIGVFAGLMNAVPYVGPLIGAIPGMFSLMMDPSATMPWWSVGVLFLTVHMIDNVAIYPMTVGKSLDLPPFVVILGILFGGSVAGIPGMFLTVPLLGMAKQTFIVFYSSLKSYRII
jgi:putative permease